MKETSKLLILVQIPFSILSLIFVYYLAENNKYQYQEHKLPNAKLCVVWNLNFYKLEFI